MATALSLKTFLPDPLCKILRRLMSRRRARADCIVLGLRLFRRAPEPLAVATGAAGPPAAR